MDILIIKNSAFNLGYRGFNVLYPLITTAYISRIFLADGVGEIAFAVNIVTYFTLAAGRYSTLLQAAFHHLRVFPGDVLSYPQENMLLRQVMV